MAFVFLVYKLSRPIKERFFVYFSFPIVTVLCPLWRMSLWTVNVPSVVFDIYKLAAPERHDIDIMVAR